MLHACFFYDPTCFMCIFIQYLAFLGTNLLTRCHGASSCFLLFLYFRKDVQEIFSELHGTNASTEKSRNEDCAGRTPEGGAPGGQTPPRRGPTLAHTWVLSRPTRHPLAPPLRL